LGKPLDAHPRRSVAVTTSPSLVTHLTNNTHFPQIHSPIPNRPPTNAPSPSAPSSSPPPHIVGQIVEMGFSPQQARIALAATDTGLDVPAALETLLAAGQDYDDPAGANGPETRRHQRQAPTPRSNSATDAGQNLQLQEHADKLLAQASEIGLNVFTKAGAFWASGKEMALKVYEHTRAASAGSARPASAGSARPRWMMDASAEDEWKRGSEDGGSKWRDGGGSEGNERRRDKGERNRDKEGVSKRGGDTLPQTSRRPRPEPPKQNSTSPSSLLPDIPTAYVSPFRRPRPSPANDIPTASPTAPPEVRVPSPTRRKLVPASAGEISASETHKTAGTERFKLGQYAEFW
jgi:hypothetical protein